MKKNKCCCTPGHELVRELTHHNRASGKSKACPVLPRIMSKWGRCSGSQRCGMSVGNEPTFVCPLFVKTEFLSHRQCQRNLAVLPCMSEVAQRFYSCSKPLFYAFLPCLRAERPQEKCRCT